MKIVKVSIWSRQYNSIKIIFLSRLIIAESVCSSPNSPANNTMRFYVDFPP